MGRMFGGLLVAGLLLAACGDDDDAASGSDDTSDESTSTPAATWVYSDLDGEQVTVEQTDSTSFTDGVPTAVNVIDQAAGEGCDLLQSELDFWLGQTDDPDIGERASAYAQYAIDTQRDSGCGDDELPTDACDAAFAEAASKGELEDTVEDLHPAARQCQSLADWTAADAVHPDALDGADPEVFARNVCQYGDGLDDTSLCTEVLG